MLIFGFSSNRTDTHKSPPTTKSLPRFASSQYDDQISVHEKYRYYDDEIVYSNNYSTYVRNAAWWDKYTQDNKIASLQAKKEADEEQDQATPTATVPMPPLLK
jgi:hypothetical protein